MAESSELFLSAECIADAIAELETVHDWLRFAVSQLNHADVYLGHGTDNPWDEAAALLSFVLHLPPLTNDKLLTVRLIKQERAAFIDLLQQRISQRLPAAYLTNQAYFAGLAFYVDQRVLIPRSPIAELIADKFADQLQGKAVHNILDLCTGSGCIAIACAYAFPEAEVDAVDISPDALEIAQFNIEQHNLEHRVYPILSDGFTALVGAKYDLIVTNPPYVDAEDMADLPAEYQHEPELGLASGEDGLALTRRILAQAVTYLNDGGVLVCEVGNSMVQLQQQLPEVKFNWLRFKHGGIGVFAITKAELHRCLHYFEQ